MTCGLEGYKCLERDLVEFQKKRLFKCLSGVEGQLLSIVKSGSSICKKSWSAWKGAKTSETTFHQQNKTLEALQFNGKAWTFGTHQYEMPAPILCCEIVGLWLLSFSGLGLGMGTDQLTDQNSSCSRAWFMVHEPSLCDCISHRLSIDHHFVFGVCLIYGSGLWSRHTGTKVMEGGISFPSLAEMCCHDI